MVADTVTVDLDAAQDDNLGLYIQAIGRTPLLSREREHALGMAVHMGRRALVRARRHLAARLRRALLEHPASQDMARELAVAGAELLGVDAALMAQWIRATVVACAERPPEDDAATDIEAMETTLALVARGDGPAIARLLDLGLRAGLSPADAGTVVVWIRGRLTARAPSWPLVPGGVTTDESSGLDGDATPDGPAPTLYLDGVPLAESRAGAALYGVAGLGDAVARRAMDEALRAVNGARRLEDAVRPSLEPILDGTAIDHVLAGWQVDASALHAGASSRRALCEANLRLVVSMARHYVGQGLEMTDLVQEGNIGLLRAVEGFDPARGFR
ncbi:MAG: hypothetical protein LC769_07780, partial [Chloroflexi bacterium]|nr:hypothetical protein [Chloroflexota bacterium]